MTLWAITSYFNPAGFASRLSNFRIFRERTNVPLVVAEASFNGEFQLEPPDADILIQVHGDVMWQKERLLNVALDALPSECDAVAWLDCDVVFERPDWAERAKKLLGSYVLVQPFRYAYDLARGELPESVGELQTACRDSIAYQHQAGLLTPADIRPWKLGGQKHLCDGFAWMARRELLEKHRFYDVRILGGGARDLACAALGDVDLLFEGRPFTPAQVAHLRAWATPFAEEVRGRLSYVDGRAYHLWHGSYEDRRWRTRQNELLKFDFDPASDIALGSDGGWRWSSDKKDMHAYVAQYFRLRREDG
ncbi:MAG: hypothetical protein WD939_01995 [Dehalococcoidia bacterium]